MKNPIQLSIAISIFLIAFSIAYYLVIFTPQKEQSRKDLESRRQNAIIQCNQEMKNKNYNNLGLRNMDDVKKFVDFAMNACLAKNGFSQ